MKLCSCCSVPLLIRIANRKAWQTHVSAREEIDIQWIAIQSDVLQGWPDISSVVVITESVFVECLDVVVLDEYKERRMFP